MKNYTRIIHQSLSNFNNYGMEDEPFDALLRDLNKKARSMRVQGEDFSKFPETMLPADPEIEFQKAVLDCYAQGKFDSLEKLLNDGLSRFYNSSWLNSVIGVVLKNKNNAAVAEKYFKKSLLANPLNAMALANYANFLREQQKYRRALLFFNLAKKSDGPSDNINNLINLALLFRDTHRYRKASHLFEVALNIDPSNSKVLAHLGYCHFLLNEFELALKYYDDAFTLERSSTNASNIANVYMTCGKNELAEAFFKNAMELDKLNTRALVGYSELSRDVTALEKLIEGLRKYKNFDSKNSIDFSYVDMKIALMRNSELTNKINNFNSIAGMGASAICTRNERELKSWIYFAQQLSPISPSLAGQRQKYIFIVGMPRSGTTLLEQLLVKQNDISSIGEGEFLGFSLQTLLKNSQLSEKKLGLIANGYSKFIADFQLEKSQFIIDKMPLNFRWIPFITKYFPDSLIVHVTRSSEAIVWSNIKIKFSSQGNYFSYSAKGCRDYIQKHEYFVDYIKKKINPNIHVCSYEKMVTSPQNEIRHICERLGIKFDPELHALETSGAFIKTASFNQAREKVHTASISDWRKYEDVLSSIE